MKSVDEQPRTGGWTAEEHYVFISIVRKLVCAHSSSEVYDIDVPLLTDIYNQLLRFVKDKGIRVSISAKVVHKSKQNLMVM